MKSARAALVLLVLPLAAQQRPIPHTIRATGEATVAAAPDRVQIDIGVLTQARTAAEAAAANATQSTAVLEKCKAIVGSAGRLRTLGYSLNPRYVSRNNAGPVLDGYTASNIVQLTLDDISITGRVIDAAAAAGSNEINSIAFLLKDDQAIRAEALAQAARKAQLSGESIARALGLKVVSILSAEADAGQMARPMMAMQMGAARASTPVEAGTIEVRASVTVTLEVAP